MNSIFLVGNIGKDAESQKVGEWQVIKFSLATSKKFKKDGKVEEETQWHNIQYFSKSDKILPYLLKGTKVCVRGEIQHNEYKEKWYTQIKCQELELLGGEKKTTQSDNKQDPPF